MTTDRQAGEWHVRLRALRRRLGLSQLDLAMTASISTRHLSFLETARARPSAAMVDRLADALELDPDEREGLRVTAGFAPRQSPTLAELAFSAAISIDDAASQAQVVEQARGPLAALGMTRFFLGSVPRAGGARDRLEWTTLGAFPTSWLEHYDTCRYAEVDPLVTAATRVQRGFFWTDIVERSALSRPARAMFDDAADCGVHAGFVASTCQPDGSIRLISMMGDGVATQGRSARLALEVVGRRMIERLGALEPALPGR